MRSSPSRPISRSCAARRIAKEFILQAVALGLTGIGIADRNSVAGVVRAYSALDEWNEHVASEKEKGNDLPTVKLAVGARLCFADGTPDILAYPQNRNGWGRLTRLLTVGKSRGEKAECILYLDDLIEHIAGLNLIVMPPARIKADELGAISDEAETCCHGAPSGSPPACSIAATTRAASRASRRLPSRPSFR